MKTLNSFETTGNCNPTTRCNIPEDLAQPIWEPQTSHSIQLFFQPLTALVNIYTHFLIWRQNNTLQFVHAVYLYVLHDVLDKQWLYP